MPVKQLGHFAPSGGNFLAPLQGVLTDNLRHRARERLHVLNNEWTSLAIHLKLVTVRTNGDSTLIPSWPSTFCFVGLQV